MTNRKDMIDEAILRPGRLEIHIEITLPSEPGRLQILNIKTLEMRNAKRVTDEVVHNLPELARITKNFTGAELEGLVRNAASFALARNIDASSIKALDTASIRVSKLILILRTLCSPLCYVPHMRVAASFDVYVFCLTLCHLRWSGRTS